ncbi:MAG: hypothetical protein ACYCOU_08535 [Sulfobacillus sp.]
MPEPKLEVRECVRTETSAQAPAQGQTQAQAQPAENSAALLSELESRYRLAVEEHNESEVAELKCRIVRMRKEIAEQRLKNYVGVPTVGPQLTDNHFRKLISIEKGASGPDEQLGIFLRGRQYFNENKKCPTQVRAGISGGFGNKSLPPALSRQISENLVDNASRMMI